MEKNKEIKNGTNIQFLTENTGGQRIQLENPIGLSCYFYIWKESADCVHPLYSWRIWTFGLRTCIGLCHMYNFPYPWLHLYTLSFESFGILFIFAPGSCAFACTYMFICPFCLPVWSRPADSCFIIRYMVAVTAGPILIMLVF